MTQDRHEQAPKPVPAATVMLLRDGDESVEVLMLRRHDGSDFGGAWVFPGGVTEASDHDVVKHGYCKGIAPDAAAEILCHEHQPLSFWVTAIRECFEECGILFAAPADGESAGRTPDWNALAPWRERLESGAHALPELCDRERLVLDCAALHYVAYWTTPVERPRRYATRFFVARAPSGQDGVSNGIETTDCRWVRPRDALQERSRKELRLHPPTIANLQLLQPYRNCEHALAALRDRYRSGIPEIVPRRARGAGEENMELDTIWHPRPVAQGR